MNTATSSPTISAPTVVNIGIDGMSCGHCVAAVTKALEAVPGVQVKEVVVGSARVAVTDAAAVTAAAAAVQAAGYMVRAAPVQPPAKSGGCCGGGGRGSSCCG